MKNFLVLVIFATGFVSFCPHANAYPNEIAVDQACQCSDDYVGYGLDRETANAACGV